MLYEEYKLRLIFLFREVVNNGLCSDGFGSFSMLCPDKKNILVSPHGISPFKLRPDDIIVTDREGDHVENRNALDISRNFNLHLVSYKERENSIDTVFLIDPPNAVKRANEGNRIIFLSDCIDPGESEKGDIGELIRNPIKYRDYMLIKDIGVLIVGRGLFETLDKAKYIEEIAKINMPREEMLNDYPVNT